MKKYLILAVSAIAILAGCTKVNTVASLSDKTPITYQVVASNATKNYQAGPVGTFYNKAESFVSYARYYTTALNPATWVFGTTTQAYIDNAAVKFFDTAQTVNGVTLSASSWHVDNQVYYWPVNGYLAFFSYSPADVLGTKAFSDANGITNTGFTTATGDVDFMVADPAVNQQNNTTNNSGATQIGVPTVFKHKLTKIGFKCKTDLAAANGTITVKKIQIIDAYSVADYAEYNTSADKWSNHSTKATYTAYDSANNGIPASGVLTSTASNFYIKAPVSVFKADGTTANINQELILIPQTTTEFAAASTNGTLLSVTYEITLKGTAGNSITETKTVTKQLSTTSQNWNVGKYLTYVITINPTVIYWDPTVTDWTNDTDVAVTL